jgi:hypothetical protein
MSDAEANKPMEPPASIGSGFSSSVSLPSPSERPKRAPTIDPATGLPRGRGRPPGSKNRPRVPSGGINPPSRINNRGGRPPTRPPLDETEEQRERKLEANDKLFMLILGATKMPPEMLYTAGHVPRKAQGNPDLTELGNAISIPPDLSDSWGKLYAELTETPQGAKFATATSGGQLSLVFAVLGALYSSYRYVQQLQPLFDMVKAHNEAEARAAEERANASQQQD